MLTLFTIPKPSRGHIGVIQRNAIQSWTLLRPACEIILFGDDDGTAEAAAEFGVRHVSDVARNEYGTPLVNDIFEKAQRPASHDVLCYVNADIILMSDFVAAVQHVSKKKQLFLMVGQRRDLEVNEPLDFNDSKWESRLRAVVVQHGSLHGQSGIDYFVFRRRLYTEIPPLAIGRSVWDNWLVYRARSRGAAVIDATPVVMAVHQNHDFSHHPQGEDGVRGGPEKERNLKLAGGRSHRFTLWDATWVLGPRGLWPALTYHHLRRRRETLPILFPQDRFRIGALRSLLSLAIGLREASAVARRALAFHSTHSKQEDQETL